MDTRVTWYAIFVYENSVTSRYKSFPLSRSFVVFFLLLMNRTKGISSSCEFDPPCQNNNFIYRLIVTVVLFLRRSRTVCRGCAHAKRYGASRSSQPGISVFRKPSPDGHTRIAGVMCPLYRRLSVWPHTRFLLRRLEVRKQTDRLQREQMAHIRRRVEPHVLQLQRDYPHRVSSYRIIICFHVILYNLRFDDFVEHFPTKNYSSTTTCLLCFITMICIYLCICVFVWLIYTSALISSLMDRPGGRKYPSEKYYNPYKLFISGLNSRCPPLL
jgi:hypothetical protein